MAGSKNGSERQSLNPGTYLAGYPRLKSAVATSLHAAFELLAAFPNHWSVLEPDLSLWWTVVKAQTCRNFCVSSFV